MSEARASPASDEAGGARALDVLIVGGGPAGLTAALYLARFHLAVAVVDRGGSRASLIPRTRNQAGFPDGIAGSDLLGRMRDHAAGHGAELVGGEISAVTRMDGAFVARAGAATWRSSAILLATGVANRRPPMAAAAHDLALAQGLLRYCPICDGFEVSDRRVAVLGTGDHGVREAIFLRSFTADLTLVAVDGGHDLDAAQRALLAAAGIAIVDGPCRAVAPAGDRIAIAVPAGEMRFDTAYPALGSRIHSELARQLGATTGVDGCLTVDAHQRTDVAGLYAAGDVVAGLDQIGHAVGEGGVAAVTIRNDLAKARPLRRAAR